MPTTKLNLPTIDNTKTADVVRDMNALAEAVDAVSGASGGLATLDPDGKVPSAQLNISAPADATTSTKGIVMLEDSTTSTSVTKAATPKSVKAVSDQVGTLATLNTTAKNNLVAAVNELFTLANDGKAKWSNVVGSPLASSDTFAQMQTKTQTIKDTLATNLTAKGQTSAGTETLTALVNKVMNIILGKKWAEGTTNAVWKTSSQLFCDVSGLDFTPRTIIVAASSPVGEYGNPFAILLNGVNRYMFANFNTSTTTGSVTGHLSDTASATNTPPSGSFSIIVLRDASSTRTVNSTVPVSWFAIE